MSRAEIALLLKRTVIVTSTAHDTAKGRLNRAQDIGAARLGRSNGRSVRCWHGSDGRDERRSDNGEDRRGAHDCCCWKGVGVVVRGAVVVKGLGY